MKNDLEKLREEIDEIDKKILELINKRALLALKIGEIKKVNNLAPFDPLREKEILEKLKKLNNGPLSYSAIAEIFKDIISHIRDLEKEIKIGFLGPEGTFTHQAAIKFFGKGSKFIPLPSVENIFQSMENNEVDYGVVPIENSLEGTVGTTMDLLVETTLKVIGEVYLPIQHCLLSLKDSLDEIERIYSHPQALSQCRKWLKENLPKAKEISTSSTTYGASLAKEDPKSAAIASSLASEIFSLKILAKNIQDNWYNRTRFLILGREKLNPSGRDKTSIIFTVKHQAGALFRALKPLYDFNINMTLIQSRPVKSSPFQYLFFVDFQGHHEEERVKRALELLKEECLSFKILGSYPEAENDF
ncbi:MAG: prephenate dehydratase [Dictyoglomaceae bacterium]|nr:prephenate dehydratase [Dictyoglomaceae bacterium]